MLPLRIQMHVEAVVRRICLAADEPLGEWLVPFEDFRERPKPVQLTLGQIAPKFLGIGIRSVSVARPTLDDVFMRYTGSTIRDAEEDPGAMRNRRIMQVMAGGRR